MKIKGIVYMNIYKHTFKMLSKLMINEKDKISILPKTPVNFLNQYRTYKIIYTYVKTKSYDNTSQ